MAHLALYRQFRPQTFDEVIAQEHIVKTLKHQIQTNTISHAYLFCGTRGTGKTSCAKIFARAVNCLNPQNGSPCGECEVCKKIASGASLDIMEIDAASNNRVDEIRDLREKVGYLPSVGKYKVYIIDEVHMLTDSAFNALLKTLEEPPEHIIFILATTEPDKLPATILSRCMRFDFKLVGIDDLSKLLMNVLDKTNTQYEPKALELIAKAGNGSVRDTLSVAEMCKAFAENNITYKSVQDCLGLTDDQTLFDIAKAIVNKDGGAILQKVDMLFEQGKNLNVLLSDLCDYFKNVLTLKLANNYDLKVPQNVLQSYNDIASITTEKYLLDCLKKICDNLSQIKYSANIKVFVETTLLSLFYNDNLEIEMLKQRLSALESGNTNNIQNNVSKQNVEKLNGIPNSEITQGMTKLKSIAENDTMSHIFDGNANSQTISDVNSNQTKANKIFGELIGYIRSSGEMMLFAGLSDVKSVDIENDVFVFKCASKDTKDLIDAHKNLIVNFLKDRYKLAGISAIMYVDGEQVVGNKLADMLDGKLKIE